MLYKKKSAKWRDITKVVAYHIAKDMVPVVTVDHEGFKNCNKTTDPRYQLPSRNYFSREVLPEMYTDVRKNLTDWLAKVTNFAHVIDM